MPSQLLLKDSKFEIQFKRIHDSAHKIDVYMQNGQEIDKKTTKNLVN